jgi:hypothetical protein
MKKMLFISGSVACVQALLVVLSGALETYNSYRFAITPSPDYNSFGGGAFGAPFVLFLVTLYFFFFLACSLVSAVLLFQRKCLRICFALTLVICAASFFDFWVLCLRHDYIWISIPLARILSSILILHLLKPHALCEQAA